MDFYKSISILALIVLIVCLGFVASALQVSSADTVFPPNISECPDFFVKEKNKISDATQCKANYGTATESCAKKSFDDDIYQNPGMGPSSGVCEKKKWAMDCGVNWDGITNNPDVCNYVIN
tara:strand:- start:2070 stop:2432 length:363 start_codon:yes stop_codon:yes gene_type:complete